MPLSESDLVHDKYRQFGIVGGRLYYEQTAPPIVIRATQLITLFAATPFECAPIGVPVVHVLPLYKVRMLCLAKFSTDSILLTGYPHERKSIMRWYLSFSQSSVCGTDNWIRYYQYSL